MFAKFAYHNSWTELPCVKIFIFAKIRGQSFLCMAAASGVLVGAATLVVQDVRFVEPCAARNTSVIIWQASLAVCAECVSGSSRVEPGCWCCGERVQEREAQAWDGAGDGWATLGRYQGGKQ